MRKVALWIGLFVGLGWSSGVGAFPIVVKNIATGIDDSTGLQLSYGTPDSDYIIGAGSPEGVGLVPHSSLFYDPWNSASSSSRFIAIDIDHPESAHPNGGAMAAVGTYSFVTSVDLTGFVPSSAQVENVRYRADNLLAEMIINGTSVFSQTISEPAASAVNEVDQFYSIGTLGDGLMQPGINLIEFKVYNALFLNGNNANPMGLRVEGLVTAEPIPEPSTALLLGIGLSALAATSRRRSQS